MIPVAGRPWLDWILLWLKGEGIKRAVLATGYKGEVVENYYQTNPIHDLRVTVSRESEPLGTAGALAAAAVSVPEADLLTVLNGDSLAITHLATQIADFAGSSLPAALVAVSVVDCTRYGRVETDATGRLRRFREKATGSGLINAGIYFFRKKIITGFSAHRPLSLESEVFPELLRANTGIRVFSCDAPFLDIGTPSSLNYADSFIRSNFPEKR
jgi:NDP-sugar pyrophosphorylase family protein